MATAQVQLGLTDQIQDILRGLRNSSTDVTGVALVSAEGFMAASLLPAEVDAEVVGGMAAALLGSAERVTQELQGASIVQTCMRSTNGYIVMDQVGADAMLVVLASENARLGVLFLDIKLHLAQLLEIL
jgi:predicted regulator of Ras-like GTPase activity (Roadblock/LC7/MglB family)